MCDITAEPGVLTLGYFCVHPNQLGKKFEKKKFEKKNGILQHLYQSGNFRAFRQVWSRRIFWDEKDPRIKYKKNLKKSLVEVWWKSGGSLVCWVRVGLGLG